MEKLSFECPSCLLAIDPPSNLNVTNALESQLSLTWSQEGVVNQFTIYWKIENGNEYNITIPGDATSYLLNDTSLTAATMYYISMTASARFNTSDRSNTIFAGTGMYY